MKITSKLLYPRPPQWQEKQKTANLKQENIIDCRKTPEQLFLPAAKPSGQGEESVVLLGMVGDVGGTTFTFLMYTFWGVSREKIS